jgi:hypothetical protein
MNTADKYLCKLATTLSVTKTDRDQERKKRSEHLGGKKNFDHQSGEKKTRVNSRRKREYPPIEE